MTYANACRIKVIEGRHYLTMPDGTVLPRQLECKVITRVNQATTAIVEVFVNLSEPEEEANKTIHPL